jgi:tellurite resistance protein/RNA polymerase subunit RPABC4/transcription elongation factor Spt4
MQNLEIENQQEDNLKNQATAEFEEQKKFAKTLKFEDVKNGEWFFLLLQKVVESYNRNARAEYFQQKYPGLEPDEIADKLISVAVRYAIIVGAVAGAATTANIAGIIASAGMTAALFVSTIGAEMLTLSQLQMRLILDLSVIYDLQINPEDPEDIMMVFGYALGVAPTEMIGKGMQVAAGAVTKGAIKQYISKGTLQSVKKVANIFGFKILQRTIIKYAVPGASAAVGSGYNYLTTKSVGNIAKAHFKNRGQMTEELRILVSRQNTYDLAFPAAVMYVARVDGNYSQEEKEFYKAMISRMSFDEHTQAEFHKLIASEENILDAIAEIEDIEIRQSLMETIILMAIYDGELAQEERDFLENVAERLNIAIDIDEVEQRTKDYQTVIEKNKFEKVASSAGGAAVKAIGAAGKAANSVKGSAIVTGEKVKGVFGKALAGKNNATATCSNCGNKVSAEYQFCPGCGQSLATEKKCMSCDKLIPIEFSFCPHCGQQQSESVA